MKLRRRARRLETLATTRLVDAYLVYLAETHRLDPDALRAEAVTIRARFAAPGIVTEEESVAWLARELGDSPETIRRELAEIGVGC